MKPHKKHHPPKPLTPQQKQLTKKYPNRTPQQIKHTIRRTFLIGNNPKTQQTWEADLLLIHKNNQPIFWLTDLKQTK